VVGSATGQGFHKLGHEVIFYDISKEKLRTLKSNGFNVAEDLGDALSQTDIAFVCVNTPTHNSQQDLSQILSALYQLANYLIHLISVICWFSEALCCLVQCAA